MTNISATKKLLWALFFVAACIVTFVVFLVVKWPFTRQAMTKRLENASSLKVEMRGFRSTWFPYPGCVADDVVFSPAFSTAGAKSRDAIISVSKLTIQSTFAGLFSKPARIKRLIADGLRIHVPAGGVNLHTDGDSGTTDSTSSGDQTVIEEFRADNAVLELASSYGGQRGLVFPIHHSLFRNITGKTTIPFEVSLHLPVPPGEVESYGWIGPWNLRGTARSTPVSGTYTLKGANLGVFKGLSGQVSSRGQFTGNLERLAVSGSTDTPNFEVTDSGHPI
ncbi:MAG: hypothetical protein WA738_10725, partial [Candidatus Angelobacter sp.]